MQKKMEISSEKLSQNRPYFIFGKLIDDKETLSLISELEKTQKAIIALLSSQDFLERVLGQLLPEENIEIISSKPPIDSLPGFTLSELKLLPFLVGISVWNSMEDENDDFIQGCLLGMQEANANLQKRFEEDSTNSFDRSKILIKAKKNIEQADLYFSKLDKEESMQTIISKKLYYRMVEEGNGASLNHPVKATLHCKIETPNHSVLIDTWASKQPMEVNLIETIPGFAWGVKGMKIGETREVFIHPSFGYGIYTLLEKGIYLKVTVKLMAVDDGEETLSFSPLVSYDFDKDFDLLHHSNFAELSKKAGYIQGYAIWQHYKQVNHYSLKQVLTCMDQIRCGKEENDFESVANQDLLNRLHWNIYHKDFLLNLRSSQDSSLKNL